MISLDWKERLTQDINDFYNTKLLNRNYDIEIVYNVYPIRVNNAVPKEVIVFVAKELATKIGKNNTNYQDFYNTLWNNKGTNGKVCFIQLISRFIKRNPDFYLPIIEDKLTDEDSSMVHLLLEKAYLPMLKKNPGIYLNLIYKWLKSDNAELQLNLVKLLLKFSKSEDSYLAEILEKLKYSWLFGADATVKSATYFLKNVSTIDEELYLSFILKNKNTHDPALVEIICGSFNRYDDKLVPIVDQWAKSGNARLKKAAVNGQKFLKRKSKQV